jgi:hypothetical protein
MKTWCSANSFSNDATGTSQNVDVVDAWKTRGPFLTSPLGANFEPRGEFVPQGWILSPWGEVIPWGELLCSPLHSSKQ